MTVTQAVRDFVAKQNAGVETFLAAETGMAGVSERFKSAGGRIYLEIAAPNRFRSKFAREAIGFSDSFPSTK